MLELYHISLSLGTLTANRNNQGVLLFKQGQNRAAMSNPLESRSVLGNWSFDHLVKYKSEKEISHSAKRHTNNTLKKPKTLFNPCQDAATSVQRCWWEAVCHLHVLYSVTHTHRENWSHNHTHTHTYICYFSGFGRQFKSCLQGWPWAPRESGTPCVVMSKHLGLIRNALAWKKDFNNEINELRYQSNISL